VTPIDGPISSRILLVTGDMVLGDHYIIEEQWPTFTRRRNVPLDDPEIASLRSFGVPIPEPLRGRPYDLIASARELEKQRRKPT